MTFLFGFLLGFVATTATLMVCAVRRIRARETAEAYARAVTEADICVEFIDDPHHTDVDLQFDDGRVETARIEWPASES